MGYARFPGIYLQLGGLPHTTVFEINHTDNTVSFIGHAELSAIRFTDTNVLLFLLLMCTLCSHFICLVAFIMVLFRVV